jgi:Tfp pilus assembly protein PilF
LPAADFDHAIALKPDTADLHENRATVLADLGRFTDAAASLTAALQWTTDPEARRSLENRRDGLVEAAHAAPVEAAVPASA